MRWICCTASKYAVLIGLALLAITEGEVRASGLSVTVRVQQDFYQPLVPVTRNFRTCFQTDASGAQVLGICTGTGSGATPGEGDRRAPAAAPADVPAGASPVDGSALQKKPRRP